MGGQWGLDVAHDDVRVTKGEVFLAPYSEARHAVAMMLLRT
jgi:hypothetical protein